jgi:transposase
LVELRPFDLEATLVHDHAARAVWAFVQALDLKPLYAQIRSVRGGAGAPAIDPAILVALWLWATVDAVGSAREVARLCERDDAYRWLCGGVGVNHHTLADFRTAHGQWLDEQLSRSIAALMQRKLVTLEVMAQDGLRVRAAAKAASFRRLSKLQQLQQQARQQVQALKAELDADSSASTRRKQAARERAAREREQRLAQALQTLQDLEQRAAERTATATATAIGVPHGRAGLNCRAGLVRATRRQRRCQDDQSSQGSTQAGTAGQHNGPSGASDENGRRWIPPGVQRAAGGGRGDAAHCCGAGGQ